MRNVTMMIKSKAFNQIRKVLLPNGVYGKDSELSEQEQLNEIINIIGECSDELRSYKIKRKERRKIQQQRIERGYKPKRKTSKAEYELMKQQKENNKVA